MANRNFNRKQALDKEVKEIYAKITIGATGAPTLVTADSIGVQSVTRSSAGVYVVTLQDKYVKLLFLSANIVTPTAEDVHVNMVSETVASSRQVTLRVCTGAVATDPANGDTLLVAFQLKNSTAK